MTKRTIISFIALIMIFSYSLVLSGDKEGEYEIKNNQGVDNAEVSFGPSSITREVYVFAHVDMTERSSWFDAELQKDGKRVRRITTTTSHPRSTQDFDLIYKGTIKIKESPTFRAQVNRTNEFNPNMTAQITITAIAVNK